MNDLHLSTDMDAKVVSSISKCLEHCAELEQTHYGSSDKATLLTYITSNLAIVTPKTTLDPDGKLQGLYLDCKDPGSLTDSESVALCSEYGWDDLDSYKTAYEDHSQWIINELEDIVPPHDGSGEDSLIPIYWDVFGHSVVDGEEACNLFQIGKDSEQEEEVDVATDNNTYSLWKNEAPKYEASKIITPTGTTAGAYVSKKQCPIHGGSDIVFSKTVNGKVFRFAGAQGAHVDVGSDLSLVVDLAGQFKQPNPADVRVDTQGQPSILDTLKNTVPSVNTVRVTWPDYGVPSVHYQFWKTLWSCLADDSIPEGRVVLCCIGGHGRTGTGLASLYLTQPLNKKKRASPTQAIDFIRIHHCGNAIESPSQEKYLKEIYEAAVSDVTH